MTDLTICPREDCTATTRHWHIHPGFQAATGLVAGRPQADLTEPVDLPTAEELAKAMYRAIYGPSVLADPFAAAPGYARRRYLAASEAALALIRERLAPVEWQPIAFADIKPGMRVRKEAPGFESTLTVAGTGPRWLYNGSGGSIWDHEGIWSVDSRTIPAEPEDPRVERAAQALYEAGRDSTRPGWRDVTDKTRGKHLKLARAAVAAIDEAVES